jgi:hypothetical protein
MIKILLLVLLALPALLFSLLLVFVIMLALAATLGFRD